MDWLKAIRKEKGLSQMQVALQARIIFIGTLLHYDALLANILKKSAYHPIKYRAVISFSKADKLWAEWEKLYTDLDNPNCQEDALSFFETHKAEMLKGTAVLWEGKNSYYNLMCQKVEDRLPIREVSTVKVYGGCCCLLQKSAYIQSSRIAACGKRKTQEKDCSRRIHLSCK